MKSLLGEWEKSGQTQREVEGKESKTEKLVIVEDQEEN
jgi:hypothetical protein